MTKVFIAGSRRVSHLDAAVKLRIDTIAAKGFSVLVGDANGADKAVQRYLAEQCYPRVTVYCMKANCRNNLGGWPTHEVTPPPKARGFAYYSAKDLAMVEDAEYGLMLWDGESKGTLHDVVQMVRRNKPVVVYLAPRKEFSELRGPDDLPGLLANREPAVLRMASELVSHKTVDH